MSLPKSYRLKSRKDIQRLMSEGERLKAYPLRLVYRHYETEGSSGLRLAVSVPKRLHANAVDRNLLKRRLKELFREVSPEFGALSAENGSMLDVMIIYMSTEKLDMNGLRPKIILLFRRLHSRIFNSSEHV